MEKIALISVDSFCFINYRSELIADLVARDFEVLCVGNHDDAGAAQIRELGASPVQFRFESTGTNPIRDLRDLIRLTALLRRMKPAVTFSSFTKPVIWGAIASLLAGVPRRFVMVSGLGFVFTGTGRRQALLRLIVKALFFAALRSSHQAFFENEDDLAFFRDRRIIPASAGLRVPGSGVNIDKFAPVALPSLPVFLMTARLLREKGVAEFIAAARRIKAQFPASRFVLLGGTTSNPGSFSDADLAEMLSDGAVEWRKPVSDVRPVIAEASVFVLPSYYREGLPRATLEAMAMGRPVVTTGGTGCRETVEDGVNGFTCASRDVASLADAMRRFVENPALVPAMGGKSREMVSERFSVDRVNSALLGHMALA